LRILPTPGHTPGHVAFAAGRGKDDAVFCGDIMHSPEQARLSYSTCDFEAAQRA
jgi:glyoxylase-like metal-dependent hydrolase (beta-lactamase superfamily II)